MHVVTSLAVRTVLTILIGLYVSFFSFHVYSVEIKKDIFIDAPFGETTSLTITQSTLGLENSQDINPCIEGTCVEPFIVSNEIYTASGATIHFTPQNTVLSGDTFSVPYSACLDACQFDFYSGNIIFKITNAPELDFSSNTSADAVFTQEVCQGDTQPSYCADFDSLSFDEKQKALASINPEEISAGYTETRHLANEQAGNMGQRFNELHSGNTGLSLAGLTYTSDGEQFYGQWLHAIADSIGGAAGADEVPLISNWGFFINGSISNGEYSGSGLERSYDNNASTVTAGVDYRFDKGLIGGVAYGVSRSSLDFDGNKDGMDSEMTNVLLYATKYNDVFNIDVLIGIIQGEIETSREITLTNTIARGNADTRQLLWSVAGGYDFTNGALTYGPYSRYDAIKGHIDAYDEVNGGGLEVGFDKQKIRSQVLTVGGHISYVLSIRQAVIAPYGRVEWKKEYDHSRNVVNGHFVSTVNNENFEINVDDLDARWLQAAVGMSVTFNHGFSAYIDYDCMLNYKRTVLNTLSYGGRWEASF